MSSRKPDTAETDRLRDQLHEAGLRSTASRLAVLHVLSQAKAPLSHGDVAEWLEGKAWDRATLYRNLLDLTRVGLVRRTDVGDHVWRFERVDAEGHRNEEHPHFVCNQCGTVECLEGLTVVPDPGAKSPKAVRKNEVEIQVKGLCDRCA